MWGLRLGSPSTLWGSPSESPARPSAKEGMAGLPLVLPGTREKRNVRDTAGSGDSAQRRGTVLGAGTGCQVLSCKSVWSVSALRFGGGLWCRIK